SAADISLSVLLGDQVLQALFHDLAVRFIVGGTFVSFAGSQKRQQAKGGTGDIVVGVALSGAITFAVLPKAVDRPVAVRRLMQGKPLETGGDGRFGDGVAAPFAEHSLTGGAAAAVEASRRHLGASHAAGGAEQVRVPGLIIQPTSLAPAKTGR